jgi:streptogramin lyase
VRALPLVLCVIACGVETPPESDGSEGSGEDGIGSIGDSSHDGSEAPTSGTISATGVDGSADGSSSSHGDDDDDDDDSDDEGIVYDVGSNDISIPCEPGQGTASVDFSIIWIANSPDGTVSKIDTETATELARYRTGPGAPDPSRTSVNLEGDVAVSNRQGSVSKIAAQLADCVDANVDGVITTSQGPADVLEWGTDECVLWHHDAGFDESIAGSQGGPRATAWTAGVYDPQTCKNENAELWFGFRNQPAASVTIRKLNGSDGAVVGEVVVDEWPCNWGHGPYGGAADANGDFWGIGTLGSMFHIRGDDFTVERWDNPVAHVMYGIALDATGTPWIAGWSGNLWEFDVATTTWIDHGAIPAGPTRLRGLAIDGEGSAWVAGNEPCALIRYDTQADTLLAAAIPLPGCATPVGVSIDAAGMVWVVDKDADKAFKVDPTDYSVTTVEGLIDPYTYSDMTGAGLGLVINPPG